MHVVVVGGGFAGVKTALELSKRQIGKVTLISDHSYFLHHATLYSTATGRSTEESVIPLNVIFQHHPSVEVVEDRIESFDPKRNLISSKRKDYHYDKLVLALGTETAFFGIKGMAAHAYGIKTLEEVQEFHEHIHDEVVHQKLDKQYFVIGGGLTGVELASALNHYLKDLIDVFRLKHSKPQVVLVEAQDRILPHLSATASSKVSSQLKKQGVKVVTGHKVTGLSGSTITVEGTTYPTTTAVWTSGVSNNSFYSTNKGYFDLTKNGKVAVNPYLEALEDVYVIGDNNNTHAHGMAIPAFKQAVHVANNITRVATKRPQLAYKPGSHPVAIPVGDHWGYVEWLGFYVAGRSGNALRRKLELKGYKHILPAAQAKAIWRTHDTREVDF